MGVVTAKLVEELNPRVASIVSKFLQGQRLDIDLRIWVRDERKTAPVALLGSIPTAIDNGLFGIKELPLADQIAKLQFDVTFASPADILGFATIIGSDVKDFVVDGTPLNGNAYLDAFSKLTLIEQIEIKYPFKFDRFDTDIDGSLGLSANGISLDSVDSLKLKAELQLARPLSIDPFYIFTFGAFTELDYDPSTGEFTPNAGVNAEIRAGGN